MEYSIANHGERVDVKVSGRMTFGDHDKFRPLISRIQDGEIKTISMDLSELEFIDSAGLGLLLLMRDAAQSSEASLTLFNPSGQVRKIFSVSKFDSLFNIA